MGFRDYDPGLNRFTTRDMYTGALADMKLGADPFTGNRYAFTGGNPVTNVEIDGHFFALPAIAYWAAGAMGLSLYAATPQGQQNLRGAGEALGNLMPSAEEAGSGSSESSNEPRPSPTPQPTPGPAPRPAPRGTDTDSASCNPLPLIDGGRIYGGLEEYTNHQGKKGCRATGAFAFLTKSDRRSRTGAGGSAEVPRMRAVRQSGGNGRNRGRRRRSASQPPDRLLEEGHRPGCPKPGGFARQCKEKDGQQGGTLRVEALDWEQQADHVGRSCLRRSAFGCSCIRSGGNDRIRTPGKYRGLFLVHGGQLPDRHRLEVLEGA
jgi:hypothetical protein